MKKLLSVAIILLFFGMVIFPSSGIQIEETSRTLLHRGNTLYVGGNGSGNYSKIQDAIDNASDGDTVFVYDDSSPYYEDIIVDKSLNIIGENRDTTIIHNLDSSYVLSFTADWVNISNFSIQCYDLYYYSNGIIIYSDYNKIFNNNISENYYGIYLENSSNYNIIKNNIIYDNTIGIFLSNANNNNTITNNDITLNNYLGISIYSSNNNTIKDNSFYNNQHDIEFKNSYNNILKDNYFEDTRCCECICLHSSDNNLVTGNLIFPIYATGIRLWSSSYNIIIKNTISKGGGISIRKSSDYNIFSNNSLYFCGFRLDESYINNFYNNTINGKPLICLVDKSDTIINIDAWQIIILNCDNVTVKNQELCNTSVGIILWNSDNCSILNNNFRDNGNGISLPSSNNNIIIDNYFNKNDFGISLGGSSNNIIMDNNFYSGHHSDIEILNNSNNNIIKSNILYNNYWNGIRMWRAYNNSIIFNIVSNSYLSVIFHESSYNNITGNNITNNEDGIRFSDSSQNNIVTENNILNNNDGITFYDDNDNNYIYHNNFINNGRNAYIHSNSYSISIWDNGYPSGGNYWDDYNGVDNFSGPNQDIPGSDGIGDTPYDIPSFVKNEDKYPLIEPLGENHPPSNPIIEGKRKFKEGENGIYTFTIYSIDVNGDSISYLFNWSDGTQEWTGFYPSGEKLKINVSIPAEKGTYFIFKIKAKDIFGIESDWSELVITVPRDKALSSSPFLRFLERYPLLQAILMRLGLQ